MFIRKKNNKSGTPVFLGFFGSKKLVLEYN
jgi:hypothetical protein